MRKPKKEVLQSLLNDDEVVEELRNKLVDATVLESFGGDAEESATGLLERREVTDGGFTEFEAIVQTTGRPALLVQKDKYEQPELVSIRNRLKPHRKRILGAIPSVARVELTNHPSYEFVGTAWMLDEDVMITNRHVADVFARRARGHVIFRVDPFGEPYEAIVDFKEEHGNDDVFELKIEDVLHIEPKDSYSPDMALLRVRKHAKLPAPLLLAANGAAFGQDVAVIGYPAYDSRNDAFVMRDIFNNIFDVKRLAPGRVTGVHPDGHVLTHDCTTLGGNSGSVVLNIATGEAVGLHYAGSYLENNYAVPSALLRKRIAEISRARSITLPVRFAEVVRPEPTSKEMQEREGYDPAFLGVEVALPASDDSLTASVTPVDGSPDHVLDYLHFSVQMHKSRKMAIYTACNVDGDKSRRVRRTRDQWHYDPRIDKKLQADQKLYSSNNFHRGHLVRRLDPAWGTKKVAGDAVADTFFWTNCTPQHRNFNPKSWLALEDYILENADNHDMKISVFTGPIFKDSDRSYRGFRIPESYWKVIAFINNQTNRLSATGYIVSQADFMSDLEFAFGEFRTYQVSIYEIEAKTGLLFGDLRDRDPLGHAESMPVVPLDDTGLEGIIL